jgi:hypothetical protein
MQSNNFENTISFTPDSFRESLTWAARLEGYTFLMAIKKAPFIFDKKVIKKVSRFIFSTKNKPTKKMLIIDYELEYQNQFIVPEGATPPLLAIVELGEINKKQLLSLVLDFKYMKKFYRYSATTTYILFALIFTWIYFFIFNWVTQHIEHDQWFVRGSCDINCAKILFKQFGLLTFVTVHTVSLVAWGPIFYLVNRKKIRKYSLLSALKIESVLFFIIGVTFLIPLIKADGFSKLLVTPSKYQQGILKSKANINESKKGTIAMDYGIGFGTKTTKVGDIFKFKNFDLVFDGYHELSSEKKRSKKKSIADGVDGGDSMLSPSNAFSIFQGPKKIVEFELMILPYRKYTLVLDGQKFEWRNKSKESLWILEVLK